MVMQSMNLPAEGFVRPAQVARAFGVSRTTLYNRIKDGVLPPPQKDGSRISRWPVALIRKILAEQGGSVYQEPSCPDSPPIAAS